MLAWCYEHDVALVARGGGSGLVGGAVPMQGGVVCSMERLRAVRELEPELWRMEVEAGVSTRHVQRLARENGLMFAPDPGAAEQSQIGGNVATNAGGPHALKYGVTGAWVSGLEVVLAPGELVDLGGWARKDVAGYDLKSLLDRLRGDARRHHGGAPAPAARAASRRALVVFLAIARGGLCGDAARARGRACSRRCSTSSTARRSALVAPAGTPASGSAGCRLLL